ncbi:hypothetical protein [Achromobacter aloeverae]|uniref:DUF2147 domain-containing protein n=1 Tax=Achromobacter aloeverae TaxID=1750518 RepID=A0A4Q1HU49_9BURK|nr:hypothetical protein [Achromobacter aloeverae]RXN93285.1 hypothetical protein C7R54_06190 [Achromobacter aloeverae]
MRSTMQAYTMLTLLAAASLSPVLTDAAPAAGLAQLEGKWSYASDCNFGHYAEMEVKPDGSGKSATGTWSDGTRTGGEAGDLSGRLEGDKLYVLLCTEDDMHDGGKCAIGDRKNVGGYLRREGKKLAWYRLIGQGADAKYEKYLELQRGKMKPAPEESCPPDGD